MKSLYTTALLLLFSISAQSQFVQVSSAAASSQSLYAEVSGKSVTVKSEQGTPFITATYNGVSSDNSVKAVAKNNGSFIVRENVSNFLFYNSLGEIENTISNSSGSRGGESISEFALDPLGKTVVLYNPKVLSGGVTGSRARVINSGGNPLDIFYSEDRELSLAEVTTSGQFVVLVSVKNGTDDIIHIYDRFGNEIRKLTFDQQTKGVTTYSSGRYATVYSANRAVVYNIMTGETAGSTSFRSPVQFADYSETDQTIVAVTGSESGQNLNDVEVHLINVDARKLARASYSESLSLILNNEITLNRTGRFSYRITGLSKDLVVRGSF